MRGTNGVRSGRVWFAATTGATLAVTLLMMVAPASAGATVAPHLLLKAPYKGTIGIPNTYLSTYGCAGQKLGTPKWSAKVGKIAETLSNAAKACPGKGNYGGGGSAYGSDGIQVLIPFKVSSTGNHSVTTSLNVTLATSQAWTIGGCPKANVNTAPPLYSSSSGYCNDGTSVGFTSSAYLADLSNTSWYNYNYSYFAAYNSSYWQNSTYCYNYGTPSCSNFTGGSSYGYGYGYNDMTSAPFAFSGTTTITLWSNGTSMKSTDTFALVLSISITDSASASGINLLGPWAGSASTSINMGPLANGCTVNSVGIV